MKPNRYGWLLVVLIGLLLGTCKKDEEIVICGSGCPSTAPWRVESLDLGLPCFASRDACVQWANSHGYSDKPCVKCD